MRERRERTREGCRKVITVGRRERGREGGKGKGGTLDSTDSHCDAEKILMK